MLASQPYVDNQYNTIINNQVIFFHKTLTLDVSHYFNGDGTYYIQPFTVLQNGYIPYIYVISSFSINGTVTVQSSGSFEVRGYQATLRFNNQSYLSTNEISGELNVPTPININLSLDRLLILTLNNDSILEGNDTSQNGMALIKNNAINNPTLYSNINMRGLGSSYPSGTVSGTASITMTGIGIKYI